MDATTDSLTLNLGIRFDYFRMYNQADTLEPGLLVPNRNISIPETPLINFKDISPRVAAAFDLFGSGKTALKVGLNNYMGVLGPQLNYMNGILTPIEALANTATRSWNDRLFGIGDPRTGNYVPDCDLTVNAANGECGIVSNTNFGNVRARLQSDVRPAHCDRFWQSAVSMGGLGWSATRPNATRLS